MAALGITVLKNNAPWGPFTREQIEDGLVRGDFTVKYLAHATGLKEWLPLGEVLDYVDRNASPFAALPPVPEPRRLPPLPGRDSPELSAAKPPALPPPVTTMGLPEAQPKPATRPEVRLEPASFFRRSVAFFFDFAILFVPLGILYIVWALAIELPAAFYHTPHQVRMDEWDLLHLNIHRLFWLDAICFGWLYGAGLEASSKQATFGKRWVGIKVTDTEGHRIGFLQSSGRYAAKYLSAFPCFLGFIAALFSSNGLALHDRVSKTRVVRK